MDKWLILTGMGAAIRGRYEGTKAQVTQYCKEHYLPNGYKIVKDKEAYLEWREKGGKPCMNLLTTK